MAFKTNYKAAQENELIPVGEYEVYIADCGFNTTPSGTQYFSIQTFVRDDVQQEQQGRRINESLWMSEKAMPISEQKMQRMSLAANLGDDKEYETWEDWGHDMLGRFMRVKVTHSKPTDIYEARAQISRYMPSTAPAPLGNITGLDEVMSKRNVYASAGFKTVDDAELPF